MKCVVLALFLLLSFGALAQPSGGGVIYTPTSPAYIATLAPVLGGSLMSVSVTTSSLASAFPAATGIYTSAVINNTGANAVSFAVGNSGVVATVNNSGAGQGTIAAGGFATVSVGAGYVALISSGGSSTVSIQQYSQAPQPGYSSDNPAFSIIGCGTGSVDTSNPCPVVQVTQPSISFSSSGSGLVTIGTGSNTYLDTSVLGTQSLSVRVSGVGGTLTWLQSPDGSTTDPVECTRQPEATTTPPLPTYSATYSGNVFVCRLVERYFAINASASGAAGVIYPIFGTESVDPTSFGTNISLPYTVTPPQYGQNIRPLTVSATGTTGVVTAALANNINLTTYICGYKITSTATAATTGTATITGTTIGTMSLVQGVGTSPAVATSQDNFNPCIQASASNTAISVVSVAAGSGGVTAVYAYGFQE